MRHDGVEGIKWRCDVLTPCCELEFPRNVVDSIQAINGQNADKIIGLRVLNSLKTHKQS